MATHEKERIGGREVSFEERADGWYWWTDIANAYGPYPKRWAAQDNAWAHLGD